MLRIVRPFHKMVGNAGACGFILSALFHLNLAGRRTASRMSGLAPFSPMRTALTTLHSLEGTVPARVESYAPAAGHVPFSGGVK